MKRLVMPVVLMLCALLIQSGCATRNGSQVRNEGVTATTENDRDDREKVIFRLEEVGYSREEATARVDEMSGDEIAYFADHPESIKRSGFIIIASCIGSSIYSSVSNAKKKRESYVTHLREKISTLRTEITLAESQRMNKQTVLSVEQDPARRAELEAESQRLAESIKSKQEQIKLLEDDIQLIVTKKKKVPKQKDW